MTKSDPEKRRYDRETRNRWSAKGQKQQEDFMWGGASTRKTIPENKSRIRNNWINLELKT